VFSYADREIDAPKALAQLRSRDSLRALRVLASSGFPQLHSPFHPPGFRLVNSRILADERASGARSLPGDASTHWSAASPGVVKHREGFRWSYEPSEFAFEHPA